MLYVLIVIGDYILLSLSYKLAYYSFSFSIFVCKSKNT